MNFLPVQHPEYQYQPSRNPYWAKLKSLTSGAYLDEDCEKHKGRWISQFESNENLTPQLEAEPRLTVEFGCNGGHVTRGNAKLNPNDLYIGVDWKFKQIYLAYEKAKKAELTNTLFLRARAERVNYLFGENEVDNIFSYFPDPWPKKAHKKHRYLDQSWFDLAFDVLKPGGMLHIKTDHDEYFDSIMNELAGSKFEILPSNVSFDLHSKCQDPKKLEIPEVTLFEKIFIRDGIRIKSVKVLKPLLN